MPTRTNWWQPNTLAVCRKTGAWTSPCWTVARRHWTSGAACWQRTGCPRRPCRSGTSDTCSWFSAARPGWARCPECRQRLAGARRRPGDSRPSCLRPRIIAGCIWKCRTMTCCWTYSSLRRNGLKLEISINLIIRKLRFTPINTIFEWHLIMVGN